MFAVAWPGAGAKPHGWELMKVKVSPSTAISRTPKTR